MIEIVSATRMAESEFWNQSALGISLQRLQYDKRWAARITFENRRGLPDIYNARIFATDSPELLVFVHDDVWIDDYFFVDRVINGLQAYDVIGVAGNRRRLPHQPAWAFINTAFTWDTQENLSGAVAHGQTPFGGVSAFGSVPAECELMDGVFFAAGKSLLVGKDVRFDPRFDFHFYDMDFCRSARNAGLRLGTWPVCLTHKSGGAFGSAAWKEKYRAYIEKWGE